MADQGKTRERSAPKTAPPRRDPARYVVLLLGAGVAIALLLILISPSHPSGAPTAPSVSTEGKVFEGKRYKYQLKTPPGASWRALPDVVLKQRVRDADTGIERAGSDTAVLVLASEMLRAVSLEELASTLLPAQGGGAELQEISRDKVQKGDQTSLFVRARQSAGNKAAEMFVLFTVRDDVMFMVTGVTPAPVSDALAAELSDIVRGFEPPPHEAIAELPAPPLSLPEPPAPATGLLDPKLRDAPAEALYALGNAAGAEGRFQEAATLLHLAVVKGVRQAAYNLACFEARNGRTDVAFYWLQRYAQEQGIDADWAAEDSDLEALRNDRRWPDLARYLRRVQRYWGQQPSRTHVIAVPKAYVAGRPIPACVALHGLGASPEDFGGAWAQKAADSLSIAVVSVSGTVSLGPSRFAWAEDVEQDHARIEKAITALSERATIAPGKVVLIGFSQGAQMAAELAARFPSKYAGAIALSPGSKKNMQVDGIAPGSLAQRRFVLVAGKGEAASTVKRVGDDETALRAAGAETFSHLYTDQRAHTFPADFEQAFPKWLRFILDGTKLP